MTDDDLIVFGEDNWSAICIDPSFITTNSITYTNFYQPSYRYNYTYDYTNTYNKKSRKETPLLKKKVLSNPLFKLTEMNESDEPIE